MAEYRTSKKKNKRRSNYQEVKCNLSSRQNSIKTHNAPNPTPSTNDGHLQVDEVVIYNFSRYQKTYKVEPMRCQESINEFGIKSRYFNK